MPMKEVLVSFMDQFLLSSNVFSINSEFMHTATISALNTITISITHFQLSTSVCHLIIIIIRYSVYKVS